MRMVLFQMIHSLSWYAFMVEHLYESAFMRKSNIVVVTINYRLDILGFISFKRIYNETNDKMTEGINGISDQIVALQ